MNKDVDVALATCQVLPEPDPDAAPLLAALEAAGLRVATMAWDDPSVEWERARLVLLRSTWNYFLDRDAFIAWARRVAAASALFNPVEIVEWNTHKRYLLELDAADIPTVPTALHEAGSTGSLAAIARDRDWSRVVVKPAISAGSYMTALMDPGSADDGETFAQLGAERDLLIQPFVDSVRDYGERSLVLIEGTLTHAVRKSPRFGGEEESIRGPLPTTVDEEALAARALEAIEAVAGHAPPLYARVDMANDADGRPMLMELELTEPSLFFDQGPEALERLVSGLQQRLEPHR